MFTREQVLAKVEKLIALGENAGATEAERERAMAQAHKFLAKYNLDMAAVGSHKEPDREDTIIEFHNIPSQRQIANAIARLYFCNYLFFKKTNRHMLVGEPANVKTASYMIMYVINSLRKEANTAARAGGGSSTVWNSFMYGAADVISNRVTDMIYASKAQTSTEAGAGTALVLADVYDTERKRNAEYLEKMFGKLSSGKQRKRTKGDYDAYQAGADKGRTVSLNTQVTGTKRNTRRITG